MIVIYCLPHLKSANLQKATSSPLSNSQDWSHWRVASTYVSILQWLGSLRVLQIQPTIHAPSHDADALFLLDIDTSASKQTEDSCHNMYLHAQKQGWWLYQWCFICKLVLIERPMHHDLFFRQQLCNCSSFLTDLHSFISYLPPSETGTDNYNFAFLQSFVHSSPRIMKHCGLRLCHKHVPCAKHNVSLHVSVGVELLLLIQAGAEKIRRGLCSEWPATCH